MRYKKMLEKSYIRRVIVIERGEARGEFIAKSLLVRVDMRCSVCANEMSKQNRMIKRSFRSKSLILFFFVFSPYIFFNLFYFYY